MAHDPPRLAPPVHAGDLETPRDSADDPPLERRDEPPLEPRDAAPPDLVATTAPIELTFPSWRTLARWLLVLLALYAIGWLLWTARAALTPFVIGLVLAYLLLPIVNRFDRFMPRWLAILTVYAGGIVLLVAAANYIIPPVVNQVAELIASIPSVAEMQVIGNRLLQEYRNLVPEALQGPIEQGAASALETLQANVTTYLQDIGTFILTQVIQIINTVTFLIGFLIIPIWLFYVLNDQQQATRFVDRVLHRRMRADFWNVLNMINEVLSDYVRGQLLLGLAVGLMVGAGLLSLRIFGIVMPYTLLLAIVAGITELIPIIGPIIGAIPGVLIGFFGAENGVQAGLAVLAVYVIVQQLENNVLVPRIIGESIGIHPAILTVVLLAMGQVFGLIGIILAAPVCAIGRDVFTYVYRRLEGMSPEVTRSSMAADVDRKAAAATPG